MRGNRLPPDLRHPFRMLLLHVPHGESKPLCARLGIHPTTLSRWRSLAQPEVPSVELAERVCADLGVSLAQISTPEGLWAAQLKVELMSPTPSAEHSLAQLANVARMCLEYFSSVPPAPFMRDRLSACIDDADAWLETPDD